MLASYLAALRRPIEPIRIFAATEFGSRSEERGSAGGHAEPDGVGQRPAAGKTQDDTGDHAVASADAAQSLTRNSRGVMRERGGGLGA